MALHQVAGHAASFFVNPDPESSGSTLIKASCPIERNFYTKLGPELAQTYRESQRVSERSFRATEGGLDGGEGRNGDAARGGEFMGIWTPAFFGVLTLNHSAPPANLESSGGKLVPEPSSEVGPPEVRLRLSYVTRRSLMTLRIGCRCSCWRISPTDFYDPTFSISNWERNCTTSTLRPRNSNEWTSRLEPRRAL